MNNYLIQLLDYELWANRRIIDALEKIDNPPARALALMGHILSAQHVWYGRIMRESVFVTIWENIPVSWMGETAERQHRQLVSHVLSLEETELSNLIEYMNTKGISYTDSLLSILTHLSHHAAYHRGQIIQLIRPMVDQAPETDFIVWTRTGK